MKKKIILLAGPTASGKTKIAIKLAKSVNGEIINADSMQVYKDFEILSSRPSRDEIKLAKHHLYGFQSSGAIFSTGKWLKLASDKIYQIVKKGKVPILVGGTGLYFKAITDGISKIPNIKFSDRNRIRNLHKKLGQKKFFEKLIKLDPISKHKISSSDTQRSLRAYEVKKFTKKSLHEWFKNTKSNFLESDFVKVYIDYPRQELIKRINLRARHMIENGAIKEVQSFMKLRVRKDNSANKAIGINEIRDYLKEQKDLNETREKIAIKTRQYAKRQSTWARGNMNSWMKLKPQEINNFLKKI